ncbi:hypothetical protein LINPERPRIM_LOCUS5255, partial [Linum perenne]
GREKFHCFKEFCEYFHQFQILCQFSNWKFISAWSSSANGLQVHKRRNTYEVVLSPNLEWVGGNSIPLGITSSFSRNSPSLVMEARRGIIIWFLPPILTTNHLLQLFRSAEFGFCFGFKGGGSLVWSMWKPDFGFHEFERGGHLVRVESDCDFQFWKFRYWCWHFLLYEYVQGKPIERQELVYWVQRRDRHSLGLVVVCLPKPNAWIIHAFYLNCYKGWHGTLLQYLFVANYASRYSLLNRTVRDDGLQRQRGQSYVIHLLMLQFKENVVCCFCLDIGLGASRISRGREGCRYEWEVTKGLRAYWS